MICELCTGNHPDYFCPKREGFGLPAVSDSERSVIGLPPRNQPWSRVEHLRAIEREKKARWRAKQRAARMAS